jgi:KDO2-lipid IV(A) lauroyltransferase
MSKAETPWLKDASHRLQYYGVLLLYKLFSMLPVDTASQIGGSLARIIGPLLSSHKRALGNLRAVFPAMTDAEIAAIARQMWDNSGRVMAEYVHLETIMADPGRVTIIGLDRCAAHMAGKKSGFALTGHYGNWEVTALAGRKLGMRQVSLYRAAKNPYVDELVAARRRKTVSGGLLAKADGNMRAMMRLLSQGHYIGMMVDQREDRGLTLQFLGRPSNTVHAPALLARRGNLPIFIGRARRTKGAYFELECLPVPVDITADWERDVQTTTQKLNDILTSWIIESPEQWFWAHRRW